MTEETSFWSSGRRATFSGWWTENAENLRLPKKNGESTLFPRGSGPVSYTHLDVYKRQCQGCGACVPVCPSGARMITGRAYTARELYREAAKDAAFYRKGGGGVTLSGGEVLLQWEVASETLRLCRTNYVNTCIETSAFAPWAHLWQVAQYLSLIHIYSSGPERQPPPGPPGAELVQRRGGCGRWGRKSPPAPFE